VTFEKKASVLVCDGERIAIDTIAGFEFALEVGCPKIVRGQSNGWDNSRVLMGATTSPLHHESTTSEEISCGAGSWPFFHVRMSGEKNAQNLSCAPEWMLATEIAYEICERLVDAMRTMMRSSASIAKSPSTFFVISREPLVTDSTTDSISSTQLRHRKSIAQGVVNELNPLFHR
jgi:hypothetical protein